MKLDKDFTFSVNIISENSAPQVRWAATKSRELLKLAGGIEKEKADAQLCIDLAEKTAVADNGFELKFDSGRIDVRGSAEGVRCGAFDLLMKLGFRWFSPNEQFIIPELPLSLEPEDFNYRKSPSFNFRGLHICGANHYDRKVAEWMSFNKMNRKLTHLDEEELLGDELDELGLYRDTTVHSYSLLIPDEEFFDSNPEWFSLIGGKRLRHAQGGQLCLSNKAMRDMFVKRTINEIDRYPNVLSFGICPNDGYGWCECENCRRLDTESDIAAGDVNGRIADFVHYVCEKVKELRPKVLLGHYSYSNFRDFLFERKEFPDNLLISFTQYRCFRHAMDSPECPCNREYFQRLEKYRERVSHIYIYDYYIYRWKDLPAPLGAVLEGDIKAYHRLGLDGFLSEVSGAVNSSWNSFHPAFYFTAAMLFDVEASYTQLLEDYCEYRYGAAGKVMLKYFKLWDDALSNMPGCFTKEKEDFDALVSEELLLESSALIDEAERITEGACQEPFVHKDRLLLEKWRMIYHERKKLLPLYETNALPVKTIEKNIINDMPGYDFTDYSYGIPDAEAPTKVRFFTYGNKIGLNFECFEPDMDSFKKRLNSSRGDNGGLGKLCGDNIEIFFAKQQGEEICWHFLIDANSRIVASECHGTVWNWAWEHHLEIVEVKLDKDKWTLTVLLPVEDIGIIDSYAFSAVRNRNAQQSIRTGIPDGGSYFDTQKYLTIKMR